MKIFNNIIEWVNNTTWIQIILLIIASIFSIYVLKLVFSFINSSINFLKEKSRKLTIENREKLNLNTTPSLTIDRRIDITNAIFDLIAFMIANEIYSVFKPYQTLGTPYQINKFDEDLTNISKTVFEGLKVDLFTDPNILVTKEYLMAYITKRTTSMLLDNMIMHNLQIRVGYDKKNEESD